MKTGLIMEGGAMRGMFTAGVLDVLMENGLVTDGAIGVSAGAVFGCNYKSHQIGRVIRYNTEYCNDKRYASFKNLVKTGNLYSEQFCYHEVPEKLDPFNEAAFAASPMDFFVVCTDVKTGEPIYHKCRKGDAEDVLWMEASASMPLAAKIVKIGHYGLLDGGVYCSLKHFPGHGDTAVDSHLGLPCIDRSFDELMQRELKPFIAGIEAGAPAVMTTHILFPQIEPEHIPATMSRRIMTGLLREKLGFGGIIISDCMEMDAIKKFYGTVNGVLAAMKAGVDLVFVSQTPALAAEAMQNARCAAENGELDLAELDVSVQRLLEAKAQCAAMQPKMLGDEAACRARAEEVRAASITAVHLPRGGMPALGDNPLFLGCADYRSTIASNGESSGFTFPEEMRRHADKGTALVTDKDPGNAEIAEVVSQAAAHSCIVLGTYNGHILQGQLRLAKALAATGLPMILVALRNPYDLRNMPNHVAALAGWEYTRPLFDALWPVLNGTARPTGKLPLLTLTKAAK